MATLMDEQRVLNLLIISLIIALFVVVNDPTYRESSIVYVVFGLVMVVLYKLGIFPGVFAIDANVAEDAVFGAVIAAALIFLNSLNNNFTLLFPVQPESLGRAGAFLIYSVFAPIFENTFFIDGVLPFIQNLTNWSYEAAAVAMGVVAASFHALAHGYLSGTGIGSLALLSGTFLSTIVVFTIFAIITKFRKSQVSGIVAHSFLNTYLARGLYLAVSGV